MSARRHASVLLDEAVTTPSDTQETERRREVLAERRLKQPSKVLMVTGLSSREKSLLPLRNPSSSKLACV